MSATTAPNSMAYITPKQPGGSAPLFVVLAGTFITFLDFFIVNVALPSMASDLHAGSASMSLVVAGYALTFAAGMITGGRLGDLFGRRRMFMTGLSLFTLTSLSCGLAPTVGVLIAARFAQGAAGALLTPQVLAIINTAYDGRQRQRAFAGYGLAMGIAGVFGQLVGGALIEANVAGVSWRAIFLINVPVGLVVLATARHGLSESYGARTRLDLVGGVTVTAGLVALVLPLVEGRQQGWPLWTWISFALVPALTTVFVLSQRRVTTPLVDLAIFRSRSFAAGSMAAFTFALVPGSFFFVLALYLQEGRGFGPFFSGVIFVAVGVGYFAAMMAADRIAAKLGYQVLALGSCIASGGCALLAATARDATSLALLPGLALVGFGVGTVLVPVSAIVLVGTDPQHAGAAAGALATAQQVGGAVGVAVIGTVFFAVGPMISAFVTSVWVVAGVASAAALVSQLVRPPSRR